MTTGGARGGGGALGGGGPGGGGGGGAGGRGVDLVGDSGMGAARDGIGGGGGGATGADNGTEGVDVGGGGGAGAVGNCRLAFLVAGGGGGGFAMVARAADAGLDPGFGGTLLRFAKGLGIAGEDSDNTGLGLKPSIFGTGGAGVRGGPKGGGAGAAGGRGAKGLVVSESEYEDSLPAPVSIPPLVFLSLGIPPAKSPPSCGAPEIAASALPLPVSLLLLPRCVLLSTGGAKPPGTLILGTGGAAPAGAADVVFLSRIGPDLSFVTACFKRVPFEMSARRAPWDNS